ncbi:MAG TPA: GspE/PulE family protein [Burkholderiales bacterium]|nr:GspE/PulE family protein [Burkholderiales bacterium]
MGSTEHRLIREGTFHNAEGAELTIVERVISPEQLRQALRRERAVSTLKLGARLLELRLITQDQLNGALQVQNTDSRRHLGEILLDLGLVSRVHLHQVLCEKLGIPLIELAQFGIDGAVLRLLPEELVRKSNVVPLCRVDGKLVVAMSDPLDPEPLERVRFVVQMPVMPVMASVEEIEQAIRTYYGPEAGSRDAQAARPARPEARRADFESVPVDASDHSVVKLVSQMIGDAHAAGASDIHLDASAGAQNVTVRFRRDGLLSEYASLPGHLRAAIVTRIKAMAGIDISERRRAQEGRIDAVDHVPSDLQLRVITVPTRAGNEDIAIKLIPVRELLPLQMIGLSDALLQAIKQLVAQPYGLVLISGPAGSGRTTTAHAILTLLNVPGAKIWTAESPAQAARSGLSQVEVNDKIGWDYPAVMSAVMRADPDVILIGELRDRATAALAVEASLKGALVLSALHGNGAADTVARLLDAGVDAFSLSDALLGVVAQRLARRLCLRCRISRPLKPAEIDALVEEYCDGTQLAAPQVRAEWTERFGSELLVYGAQGCDLCSGTGYRGRIGLYELMPGGAAMRPLMLQRRPVDELVTAAIHAGMRTLKQDGIEKALAGHCDFREVRAATV